MVVSPKQLVRVLGHRVESLRGSTRDSELYYQCLPGELLDAFTGRLWEHPRQSTSGRIWPPCSFHDFIHADGPGTLGLDYAAVKTLIERAGVAELAVIFEVESGVRCDVARPIPLASIRRDGGTQSRVAIDPDVVAEYAENVDDLPAVTVFAESIDAVEHWLADGFHRLAAHEAAGRDHVLAFVKVGGRRDAVLHSVGVNAAHGLRRTNADKRRAVETLLLDEEWSAKSDRWIAERCGVSPTFVGKLRGEVSTVDTCGVQPPTLRDGQDGKRYPPKPTKPTPAPSAPVVPVEPLEAPPVAPVEVEPPTPPPRPTNGARQQALPAFEVEADPVEVEAEPVAAVPPEVTRALDIVGALAAAMAPEHRSMFLHYSRELFQ